MINTGRLYKHEFSCDHCHSTKEYVSPSELPQLLNGWISTAKKAGVGAPVGHEFCSEKCLVEFFRIMV